MDSYKLYCVGNKDKGWEEWYVVEKDAYCHKCNTLLGNWSYGQWML